MERGAEDDREARKKIRATVREESGSVFMLRCAELGLSDSALSEMTPGMVYDMLIEQANDRHEYPIKATMDDFRAFFG